MLAKTRPHTASVRLVREAPIARMGLEGGSNGRIAASYVPTRAASHSLSLLEHRDDPSCGGMFWLGEAEGSGKTHFLNYYAALKRSLYEAAGHGRQLLLALNFADVELGAGAELYHDAIQALAKEVGAKRGSGQLWLEVGSATAFDLALAEAYRAGVGEITLVCDFGREQAPAEMDKMAVSARRSKRPRLIVVAAGRGPAPAGARSLRVAPEDGAESAMIAIARLRATPPAPSLIEGIYGEIDFAPFSAEEIFPLHPDCVRALVALAPQPSVYALGSMMADLLSVEGADQRLIYPCQLFDAPSALRHIEEELGAAGRGALRKAIGGCDQLPERDLARRIVQTVVLQYLVGDQAGLPIENLLDKIPLPKGPTYRRGRNGHAIAFNNLVASVVASAQGVITSNHGVLAFANDAEVACDLESFNRATALANLFDPQIAPANDSEQLRAGLARLDEAMAEARAETVSVGRALGRFALANLGSEPQRRIEDFAELAGLGARGLLDLARDRESAQEAAQIVESYRALARAAAWLPRYQSMLNYLEEGELDLASLPADSPAAIIALATERQLLEAELGPQAVFSRSREAVETRFEKFKWTYIEQYRLHHDRWRTEMNRAAVIADDLARYLQALSRLDSIAGLGAPAGSTLDREATRQWNEVVRCTVDGPFTAAASGRCPRCGYVLGTVAPVAAMSELLDRVHRALADKLAQLSRTAISRLIAAHDRGGRLDGFLKIVQAAQTQALVDVLDDDLTAYLSRLLA